MKFGSKSQLFQIALICFWVLGLVPASHGQSILPSSTQSSATADIDPPSPNDIRELVRLLEDERIKNWLEKEAADAANGDEAGRKSADVSIRDHLNAFLSRTRDRAELLEGAIRNIASAPAHLAEHWRENLSGDETVRSLSYVLIFLFIGGGLEWLYRQYTGVALLRLQLTHPKTLSGRLRAATKRALLIFGGLAIFAVGSVGGFLSFDWSGFVEIFVLNLLILVIVLRAIATVSMFFLAPRVSELRLVPFDDQLAKKVHQLAILSLSIIAIALSTADVFSRLKLTGSPDPEFRAAAFSVSIFSGLVCLLVALMAIWWGARLVSAQMIEDEKGQASRLQKVFAWRTYLSILSVICFGLWLIAATDIMWTILILGMLPAALVSVGRWVDYFFDEAEAYLIGRGDTSVTNATADTGAALPETVPAEEELASSDVEEVAAEELPYNTLRLITVRFFRFVLVVGAVLMVLQAWGTDIFSLAESPTLVGKISSILIDLVVAILIADLIWTWARTSIDARLASYKPPEGPQAPGPEARMATLLPLLRVILMVTLVLMVGLSVLSSAGVNVAPLLAGAGVLGVAIGFGAQSLVKDIVSGIFFLIDDAFRVGEYIEIGNLRGVVESMSIRSLRVRHHRGAVHTIPFGELSSLTNYSRDWVIMKMEFRVPFETDIKLVKKLVKRIGAEMIEDPLYKDGFLEPLKSQGVRRMEEFNMVVGVKFMAKPGDQWVIRRDAYQKIVNAFEANGIRLAERNVKVQVISDRPLSDAEEEAVMGAAQDSIEQQAGDAVPAKDEP